MIAIITDGNLDVVRQMPKESVGLMIIIRSWNNPASDDQAKAAATPILQEGGHLILANSLPEAFAAL